MNIIKLLVNWALGNQLEMITGAQSQMKSIASLFTGVLFVILLVPACLTAPTPDEAGDQTSETPQQISTNDILVSAREWVATAVPYCGGINGGRDLICGGTCQRPHAPWDAFRSDCSGYVSWSWQIPDDPTTATYNSDRSGSNGWTTVSLDHLQAGDAFVTNGHIKLLSHLVDADSADILEESDCGTVAHERVQNFTRSGNTLKFNGDSRTYHAIRRNGINNPVAAPAIVLNHAGDFNGDGRDDLVTFLRGTGGAAQGDVFVALGTGNGFAAGAKWNEFFSIGGEIPMVGDFNGDGRDDIVTFVRGTGGAAQGDVFVALSNGHGFGPGQKWHEFFSINGEIPGVGDFNGDGKADIVTFVRGTGGAAQGDVFVALSNGHGFGPGQKWHEFFSINGELPGAGDFNGDGKADVISFTRGGLADVYLAWSNGNAFVGAVKTLEFFAANVEIPAPASVVY